MNQAATGRDGSSVLGRLRKGSRAETANREPTAGVDPLTGLPDRHGLSALARRAVDRSRPDSTVALVAFLELAHLRDVNDSHGPDAGDQLLRSTADRLRTIDLPETQVLRFEGAVFALVFERIANHNAAEEVARFLVEFMSEPFTIGNESLSVPCYVGAAVSTDNYSQVDEMVRDGYQALVQAREIGHGAHLLHDQSMRGRYETRIDERRLAQALADREFTLVYQPIVRLGSTEVLGVEALLRWKAPGATNVGLLHPHDFLPLLEKSGLIVPVGRWVLEEACAQAAAWNQVAPDRRRLLVSCNLGARQVADPAFRATVENAVTAHGIEPWQLCLDVTEGTLRYNGDATWPALRDLKAMGVKIGLDDFGIGVSSLVYLRELKIDVLRVDRTFVRDIERTEEDRTIVRHIAGLAHDFKGLALAEGVETQGQAEILRELGADLAQGFHFGRPAPADEITSIVAPGSTGDDGRWDPSRVFGGQ